MNNSAETEYIEKCLTLIESRINWGASEQWTSYDFEKLSIEIQTATGVLLSVTTLKRLWGRLKYTSVPTTTTLNTLANFAGYFDWREFKHQIKLEPQAIGQTSTAPVKSVVKKSAGKSGYWFPVLFSIALISLFVLFSYVKTDSPIDTSIYNFSSNKIKTEGVPNSVIFNYNAAAAGNDSVFISQSWDISRKVSVPKDKDTYSSIYYKPGYYQAKLIIGNQTVKEHDLMISSGGWVVMIDNDPGTPLYFKNSEILKRDGVEVAEDLFSQYNVPLQPKLPALRFFNVQDMGGISNDHFIFETILKSNFHQGTAACQRVEVLILCKDDVISIPLCSKGCVGDLTLYVAGEMIESSDTDLSAFGADLNQWVNLKVEAKNHQMHFFVNGKEAYSLPFSHQPSDIIGIEYRFNGTGAVKNTKFVKDGQVTGL
ncbi:hypothetical protein [Pedobacter antarcticus]|uniref:hypothetical protein n=1 Tax=Pedobacter antarcticus TaxID=34086 RepID=UPI00292D92C1|nr:hypothetical protein [Pedobacter antarcticus]